MVATEMEDNGCKRLSQVHESDPELRRIVADWPKLSKTAKRMILAVLQTERGLDDQRESPKAIDAGG